MKNKKPRFTSLALVPVALALCSAATSVSSCTAEFEVRCPDGTEQTAGGGDVNKACGPAAGAGGAAGQGGGPGGNAGQGGTSGGPQGGNGGEGGQPLVCAGEDRACDRACVDVRVSNQHCGECNKACSGTCQAGACVPVTQLALGGSHSCALLKDGTTKCWGNNNAGQLGDGELSLQLRPTKVETSKAFNHIAAGHENTCGITTAKKLECWGSNEFSQTSVPQLASFVAVESLALGRRHSCAIAKTDAQTFRLAYCWGILGSLGTDNSASNFSQVVGVTGGDDPSRLASGDNFSCALGDLGGNGGSIECWGRNNKGQLCSGNLQDAGEAVTSLGAAERFVAITAGAAHGCAFTEGGQLFCWGDNSRGQTGDQAASPKVDKGSQPTLESVSDVSAGYDHTCAIQNGGELFCWGANGSGQIGDGTTDDRLLPTKVKGLPASAIEVKGGGEHTCARLEDESVYCWGKNDRGQLGDGTTENRSVPPRVAF